MRSRRRSVGAGRRRLGHHHMRVGAREAEGAHGGAARPAGHRLRPGCGGPRHVERRGREVDLRVGMGQMQARHQVAVAQHQQRLEEPGDAGGRHRVADIALDAAERAGPGVRSPRAERIDQGLHLDRVAQRGAGAVGLDVADPARIDAEALPDREDQIALRREVRRGEAVRAPILVDAAALDHAVDAVAVGQGAAERLEHHRPHALGGHEAIRRGIEAPAPPGP